MFCCLFGFVCLLLLLLFLLFVFVFLPFLPPSLLLFTPVTLKNYAEKYGEVSHHQVIFDKSTGNSRGFGFVTFARKADADAFLNEESHTLDGRTVGVSARTIY